MTMARQPNTAHQRIRGWGRKLKNYFTVDKSPPECRRHLF